jgi:hypothetical protein
MIYFTPWRYLRTRPRLIRWFHYDEDMLYSLYEMMYSLDEMNERLAAGLNGKYLPWLDDETITIVIL